MVTDLCCVMLLGIPFIINLTNGCLFGFVAMPSARLNQSCEI